jgi:hypothetical protein
MSAPVGPTGARSMCDGWQRTTVTSGPRWAEPFGARTGAALSGAWGLGLAVVVKRRATGRACPAFCGQPPDGAAQRGPACVLNGAVSSPGGRAGVPRAAWPALVTVRNSTGPLKKWPRGQRILAHSSGPLLVGPTYQYSTAAGSPHLTAPSSSVHAGQSRNITLARIASSRPAPPPSRARWAAETGTG